ncbi:MAG: nitroreductase family protein [Actinomycetota bacterium]|nr:nitroreductase family protein [Actinomycetota bacterium]
MDVIEAIRNRHSVKRVTAPGPTAAQIDTLLELGATAPDHGGLQPWRHVVLAGAELSAFPLDVGDTPTLIVVGLEPVGEKITLDDQAAAVAASAQLILLAADAMGLGAMWRTGSAARDPAVRTAAGLSPDGRIVAFIHLGTPADGSRPSGSSTPSATRAAAPQAPTLPGSTPQAQPQRSTSGRTARAGDAASSPGDGDLGIGSLRGR